MRLLFVLPAALALASCYAAHERITPDDWVERIVRATCEVESECPSWGGVARGPRVFTQGDLDLCASQADGLRGALAPWAAALGRGDAEIDPIALEACVDAIHDATCALAARPEGGTTWIGFPTGVGAPGLLGFDERCDAVFVRTRVSVPDGHTCRGPLDCAEGSYCDSHATCRAYDAIGSTCTALLVDGCTGSDRLCIGARCQPTTRRRSAPTGASCGVLATADGFVDERCAPGLTCTLGVVPGPPVCVPTRGDGQPCGVDGPCAGPLICGALIDGPPVRGHCLAIQRTTEPGATCARYPDHTIDTLCDPRAGLRCTSDDTSPGVCAAE